MAVPNVCSTVLCVLLPFIMGIQGSNNISLVLVVSNSSQFNTVNTIQVVKETIVKINNNADILNEYWLELSEVIVSEVCRYSHEPSFA